MALWRDAAQTELSEPRAAREPVSRGRWIQVHQAHGKHSRQAKRKERFFGERSKKVSKATFALIEHSKSQEKLFPNTFISIKAHA